MIQIQRLTGSKSQIQMKIGFILLMQKFIDSMIQSQKVIRSVNQIQWLTGSMD